MRAFFLFLVGVILASHALGSAVYAQGETGVRAEQYGAKSDDSVVPPPAVSDNDETSSAKDPVPESETKEDRARINYRLNKPYVLAITFIVAAILLPIALLSTTGGAIAFWTGRKKLGGLALGITFLCLLISVAAPGLSNFLLVSLQEAKMIAIPKDPDPPKESPVL
ncbi:MAG: hypothetical protein SGJ27_05265 [Candidatus Melainabacteria bacterium]|nr:hypothetical protein [Candidatus Melainabacteria bacterium]